MLKITIPGGELFDESTNEFVYLKPQTIALEHSLVSLSKWESKWQKAFLTKSEKSYEESIDYIRCMTLTQNVDPMVYFRLTQKNLDQINEYISSPMTATKFFDDDKKENGREVVTAELIYYWMVALNIPFECQKWHLNRLFTLIKVCNIKNSPPKKRSKGEIARRNRALNEARRAKLNTRG